MLIYLILISLFNIGCQTESDNKDPEVSIFKTGIELGLIQDSVLNEVSGMISSRKNPGLLWVINDSGNDPKLFLINEIGIIIHAYLIDGIDNTDWEDLAIHTDHFTGKSRIFIGDVGDNYAIRNHINVIVFDEPIPLNSNDTLIDEYQKFIFQYEDGSRDAETIMVDPVDSKLFIISKREEQVRIYEAPEQLSEADTMQLAYKLSLPINNVTSGDISSDGNEILIKSYTSIFYWSKKDNESILEALKSEHQIVDYVLEPQGESICWGLDNKGFYTLSEKSWATKQVLYYYEKNK